MGFFSWKTQDTNKSIPNIYSGMPTRTVFMHDDKGNIWREDEYEGYGVFGGKDFYELLAEMNGIRGEGDEIRSKGINLTFGKEPYKSPNLSEEEEWEYTWKSPEDCEYQGYFYE